MKSAFSSDEVALPVAAAEGFTGVLETSGSKIVEGLEDFAKDELRKVDSEGRCVITDHGHFGGLKICNLFIIWICLNSFYKLAIEFMSQLSVLFNIYGPRADSDDTDRIQFKLQFFKILQVFHF